MGYSLGIVTGGYLAGCNKTLPIVTDGYLNNCEELVDIPVFPGGGGSAGKGKGRRYLTIQQRLALSKKERALYMRDLILREDEEILIIIKAFLKCQE